MCFGAVLSAQASGYQSITPERVEAAYQEAHRACAKVLRIEFEAPPIQIATAAETAKCSEAENLPIVRLREPDDARATRKAKAIGQWLGANVLAKYAILDKRVLVVPRTWHQTARLLKEKDLTGDAALRAVLVHELCHALDDRKFELHKRYLEATDEDAVAAFNAMVEGHAQMVSRRVCVASGWQDGFEVFTRCLGRIRESAIFGEAIVQTERANAVSWAAAYYDGDRFVTAVLAARPDTGRSDVFTSPPKEMQTVMRPEWYLDPAQKPRLRYALQPVLDAFSVGLQEPAWVSERRALFARQITAGLLGVDEPAKQAVAASLLAGRLIEFTATGDVDLGLARVMALEFDSPAAAARYVEHARTVLRYKEDNMERGLIAIRGVRYEELQQETWRGVLGKLDLSVGVVRVDAVALTVAHEALVLELYRQGHLPERRELIALVDRLVATATAR